MENKICLLVQYGYQSVFYSRKMQQNKNYLKNIYFLSHNLLGKFTVLESVQNFKSFYFHRESFRAEKV